MLLGVPVTEVLAEIPDRKRGTTAGQLAAYLVLRGWRVVKPVRFRCYLPGLCIVRVAWTGPARKIGHWVLVAEGKCFDPADTFQLGWVVLGGRIVSFMALGQPAPVRTETR